MSTPWVFKIADQPDEMEAIHRLNHRTFAEEIPQHESREDGRLVDKFHDTNLYCIALKEGTLAGMVALRTERPFSLEAKLPDLDTYLTPGRRYCEVRLLTVEKEHRGTAVTAGLLRTLTREAVARGFDAAVISATTRQLRLYRHIGFVPFGPLVGREGAWYQPMSINMEQLMAEAPTLLEGADPAPDVEKPVNFLPGPVAMTPAVRAAFAAPPQSHRGHDCIESVASLRWQLGHMAGIHYSQIMAGSGTLANEAVGAQLLRLDAPGMVVSFGEFGERLADHARRLWLPHEHLCLPWGHVPDVVKIAKLLDRHPEVRWLWTTHCETSTGAMIDLDALTYLCHGRDIRVAIDAVSTFGVMHCDLSGVWMASAASGKGLAAYPGLAIVLHNDPIDPAPERLPRYLDLGLYASSDGIPFTLSSNLTGALRTSVETTDWWEKYSRIKALHRYLRPRLEELGATILIPAEKSNPAVLTLPMPPGVDSIALASRLEAAGFLISARSPYLATRGWIQICLMGDLREEHAAALLQALRRENPWRQAAAV
jgi:aspartate aminotransferase-like enzyme/GNAT superfamily N-acetyltransferase